MSTDPCPPGSKTRMPVSGLLLCMGEPRSLVRSIKAPQAVKRVHTRWRSSKWSVPPAFGMHYIVYHARIAYRGGHVRPFRSEHDQADPVQACCSEARSAFVMTDQGVQARLATLSRLRGAAILIDWDAEAVNYGGFLTAKRTCTSSAVTCRRRWVLRWRRGPSGPTPRTSCSSPDVLSISSRMSSCTSATSPVEHGTSRRLFAPECGRVPRSGA
jgi:hypothetical protein